MKHEEADEFYLFEINPRIRQSAQCTICAGAELPWYYYLQEMGHGEEINPRNGVGVLISCYEDPRFDDFSLDDTRPFAWTVKHVLRRGIRTDQPTHEDDTDRIRTMADPLND